MVSISTSRFIVPLFFGSRGRGLLSMGRQSIRKTCPCQGTSCYKSPELSGWGPPLWISIRDFNIRCHLTWKSCTPHSGGGGSEAKSPTSFMEHATSMTRLSSCWLSESAQKLSHHVHMRTNDLRGLPYSEAGRASLSRLEGQGLQGTLSAVAICMKRIL